MVFSGSGCFGERSTHDHGIQKESMRIGEEKGRRLNEGLKTVNSVLIFNREAWIVAKLLVLLGCVYMTSYTLFILKQCFLKKIENLLRRNKHLDTHT
jgi:hypothetical protein